MRIIGKGNGNTFLVEATATELARVAGFTYDTQLRAAMRGSFDVGDTINVSALYDRIEGIRASEKGLINAQATLRAVANLLDPVIAYIDQAQSLGAEEQQSCD